MRLPTLLLLLLVASVAMVRGGDYYERVLAKMAAVTSQNCYTKPADHLHLPGFPSSSWGALSYLYLGGRESLAANLTGVRLAGTLALQQAFFHSLVAQWQNASADFESQPGLLYRYNSIDTYVTATSEDVVSAGLFYDKNCTYATWWKALPFNSTLDLFGLRSLRQDPTSRGGGIVPDPLDAMTRTLDYAADFNLNYTHPGFKVNDWYSAWMSDTGFPRHPSYAYEWTVDGTSRAFFGPALQRPVPEGADPGSLPWQLSRPFFDCGKTNRWLVAASAPVLDYMPRYSLWTHLRRARVVAASVVTLALSSLDLDPCLWSSAARCKNTTQCQAVAGRGFDPTAYQCVCLPGYQYPPGQNGPFLGSAIAKATEDEFTAGFDCVPGGPTPPADQTPDSSRADYVTSLLRHMDAVTSENCASKRPAQLTLSLRSRAILSSVSVEGRVALRLAHVISAAMQTTPVVRTENRMDAQRLNATHLYAELISAVMATPRILSATAIFDKGQFHRYTNWTESQAGSGSDLYFVPHVWKIPRANFLNDYQGTDLGGQSAGPRWVKDILTSSRAVWGTMAAQRLRTVERWWEMRISPDYQYSAHHLLYPQANRLPAFSDGQWLQPHFKCDGRVDTWVATYWVPFFGSDFHPAGVVTVDVAVTKFDLSDASA